MSFCLVKKNKSSLEIRSVLYDSIKKTVHFKTSYKERYVCAKEERQKKTPMYVRSPNQYTVIK